MKVGHQSVDNAELMPRHDEYLRFTRPRLDDPFPSRRRLQTSHHRRADGHDPRAALLGSSHCLRRLGCDFKPLGSHAVFPDQARLDGQERAGSDVKGDRRYPNAPGAEPIQQSVRQMQPGRRCRDGALLVGKDRLIPPPVRLVGPALDVGR